MAKTREDFLKPIPRKVVDVETEELGTVQLKQLSGSQSTQLQNWRRPNGKLDESKNWLVKLVIMSIVDCDGNVILNEGDFDAVMEYPQKLLDQLTVAAAKLNGFIRDEDEQPAGQLLGKSDS